MSGSLKFNRNFRGMVVDSEPEKIFVFGTLL